MGMVKECVLIGEVGLLHEKKITTRDLSMLRNSIDRAEHEFHLFKATMTDNIKKMKENGF